MLFHNIYEYYTDIFYQKIYIYLKYIFENGIIYKLKLVLNFYFLCHVLDLCHLSLN